MERVLTDEYERYGRVTDAMGADPSQAVPPEMQHRLDAGEPVYFYEYGATLPTGARFRYAYMAEDDLLAEWRAVKDLALARAYQQAMGDT